MPCNLILIGYRCCGKTRVGQHLSDLMRYDFVDTDKRIESDCGTDIDTLVAARGWPYFRQKETMILKKNCSSKQPGHSHRRRHGAGP